MNRSLPLLILVAALGTSAAVVFAQQDQTSPKKTVRPTRPAAAAPAPTGPSFTAPKLLWKTFLRRVDGSPAAGTTEVYTGAGRYLYRLDSGGRTVWATETGNQQSTPALDETRAYIGSDRGILYAMNRKSGQIAWQFAAKQNATIQTQPAVAGDIVFTEASDNNVYALEAASGRLLWTFTREDGSLGYSSPIFSRPAVYVCGETTLYRLESDSGGEVWRALIGGKSLSTPAVGGRRVFVGGDGVGLNAVSEEDGKPLWNFTGAVKTDWFGPPLYQAGTVYVSTYNRYVYAVDPVNGRRKWQARVLGSALSRPALDEKRGVLYVASTTFRDNPTLTAFDAKTGKKLWDFKMGYVAGSPVIAGDRLYIGSTNGNFYTFSLR